MELKIVKEFQEKIPPLTADEFKLLEENILNDGEVYEPIIAWNGTIIDGHNRWKIITANPWLTYKVKEMNFSDKWEAFDWMYKKQLGRRNLTEEQKRYLIGKQLEARKLHKGGDRRSKEFSNDQSGRMKKFRETAEEIASEHKIGATTVKRAEKYAQGIDAIREEEPELANAILNAERKLSKKDVEEIGIAHPAAKKAMINSIRTGEAEKKSRPKGEMKKITGIVESLSDETSMEYTVHHLTEQIRMNSETFIRSLSNLIMDHTDICNVHQMEIVKAIDTHITNKINQIKETLNNGTQL